MTVTATLFIVVAIMHLLRIILGWQVEIGGLSIPFWVSWLRVLVAVRLPLAKPFRFEALQSLFTGSISPRPRLNSISADDRDRLRTIRHPERVRARRFTFAGFPMPALS